MKKIFAIAAFLFLNFAANAQDKKLDKVQQLFNSKNFTECVEAAKKYNVSNQTKPDGYFLLGFSYFELYKQNPAKESQLTSTENTVFQAINKDKSGEVRKNWSSNLDELHAKMIELQDKYYSQGEKNKAGQHAGMLAKIFKDTTEVYLHIYKPELFVKPITTGKTLAAYEGETNQLDVAGNKTGVWIEKFQNGNRKSQINFEAGKPRGDFYKFYQKGGVSAHLYFYDDNVASAILYAENGDKVAMGYYYNHEKDSLWQYFEMDSIVISEERYSRGVKNGQETTYYYFGFPAEEIMWKNGKKDGPWKRYYESSTVMFETQYKNGVLDGPYVKYDIKGNKVIIGNYKNDLKVGEWLVKDDETQKMVKIKYVNGKLSNQDEYDMKQAQKMHDIIEKSKDLPDPKDYAADPTQYPYNRSTD